MSLNEVSISQSCTIQNIPSLGLLGSLGIREGATVTVVSRHPLQGPLVIRLGRRCIALDRNVASQITVAGVQ